MKIDIKTPLKSIDLIKLCIISFIIIVEIVIIGYAIFYKIKHSSNMHPIKIFDVFNHNIKDRFDAYKGYKDKPSNSTGYYTIDMSASSEGYTYYFGLNKKKEKAEKKSGDNNSNQSNGFSNQRSFNDAQLNALKSFK